MAPRISFARAVSCTPGNWTTIRLSPLPLDDRLGDAELVDPVAQRGDVLLNREALEVSRFADSPSWIVEHRISDVDGRLHDQLGHPPTHEVVRPVPVAGVVEPDESTPRSTAP